ncbi:MAG TPA: hypothetical protein VHT28_15760 [Silvibacterium sp.]|nr:hypothetical protein [Silvibacterium sp.]
MHAPLNDFGGKHVWTEVSSLKRHLQVADSLKMGGVALLYCLNLFSMAGGCAMCYKELRVEKVVIQKVLAPFIRA